ncbi:hypothetical protein J6Z48_01600 [bacterium]|nr:hypothetical protein [bacterium]
MDDGIEGKIIKEVLRVIIPLWIFLAGGGCLAYYLYSTNFSTKERVSSKKQTVISQNDNSKKDEKDKKETYSSSCDNPNKCTEDGMDIITSLYSAGNKEILPSSTDDCNGYYYLVKNSDGSYKFATDSSGSLICPADTADYDSVRKSCLNEDKQYCILDNSNYFRFVHVGFGDNEVEVSVYSGNIDDVASSNDASYAYNFSAVEQETTIANTEEKKEEPKTTEETVAPVPAPVTPTPTPTPTIAQHNVGVQVSNGTSVSSKTIKDGENADFSISPNSGYHYKKADCTGEYGDVSYDTKTSILHVNNIKGDVSCSLAFVNSKTYSVSVVSSLESEGVVVDGNANVEYGDSVTIALKPATNFYPYSNDCGGKMRHSSITIDNVTDDIKCTVNFSEVNAVLPVQIFYNTYDVVNGEVTQTGTNILAGSGEVEYSKAVNYSASASINASPFDPNYTFTGVYCTYATVLAQGNTFTVTPYSYGTGVVKCYASFYRYL